MLIPDDETWMMHDPVHAVHVSVPLVILANNAGQLQVVMQENHDGPFSGKFVLPSAMMRADQTLEEAARELCESYELADIAFEQSTTISHLRVDPRSRVMSIGFVGGVPRGRLGFVAASNDFSLVDITMAGDEALLSLGGLSIPIGFLHDGVVSVALENLRKAADYSLMPFSFVGEEFTMAELRSVHEAILGEAIVPQWFRKKFIKRVFPGDQMIVGTKIRSRDALGRPAELFRLEYVDPVRRRAERRHAAMAKKMAKRWPV